MSQPGKRTLLILFLPSEWRTYHRKPYWEALARHSQVLVVEPPAGILSVWLHPKRMIDYLRRAGKLRRNQTNIYFYRPLQLASPGIDFMIPPLAWLDRFLMRLQIQSAMKQIKNEFDTALVFLVHAQQYHFSAMIPEAWQCYEITDLYALPRGQIQLDEKHPHTKRVRRREKRIISGSDVIITSSKLIYDELNGMCTGLYYLHNAADYRHFAKSAASELEISADIKYFPRPILGFFGNINNLIDYELLTKLAAAFHSGSIVLIGGEQKITRVHNDTWYQKTKTIENIHYLGFRDYDNLPAYLQAFDVCLMPFRLIDWMRYSAPNKTYQYLASGKPVVSTDFPEMHYVEKVISIGKSHAEFIELVRQALNDSSPEKRTARQQVASENSTEKWAEKVMNILSKTLNEK